MRSYRLYKVPRYPEENIEKYMRKILVYYPKNLKALMPFTAEANSKLAILSGRGYDDITVPEITRIETLYMQILSKYKRNYIRHQNIDISYEDPYTYRPNKIETLRLYQSEEVRLKNPRVLRRALRLSKGIKHLEIDMSVTCSRDILKNARYVPSIESLHINYHSRVCSADIKVLKRLIHASKYSLKAITIQGVIDGNPVKFFKILTVPPNLKTLNLKGEFSRKFRIRQIPYKMFKDRGICFHAKLENSATELKFSTKNRSGRVPIDLLGLKFRLMAQEWDLFNEDELEAQRSLVLNIYVEAQKIRISKLLRACKDVETLDVCILRGWHGSRGNEFENLKYLQNLKNVLITFYNSLVPFYDNGDSTIVFYDGFFRNLTLCASKLQSISIQFYGGVDVEDRITKLFKVCANTLTSVTLKFDYHFIAAVKNMDGAYACLKELKQLTNLKIAYKHFICTTFVPHANKALFINPTLKEISLMASAIYLNQLNLNLQQLRNLQKIQLCIGCFEEDSIYFHQNFVIPNSVKHIQLEVVRLCEKIWYKLLGKFKTLPNLEILMLKVGWMLDNNRQYIKEKMLIDNIKLLMKGHKSLKYIVHGYGRDPDLVYVFIEDVVCCSDEEVDDFYGRDRMETLKKRMQIVYKVQKEIKEEIVRVEGNRGFIGVLKDLFVNVKSRFFGNNE